MASGGGGGPRAADNTEARLIGVTIMTISHEEAVDRGYVACILDGARGIYIPRDFCDGFDGWDGIDDEDKATCCAGPDEEWYWDAWDNVLNNASYTDPNDGSVWGLYQDGDLFAIRTDVDVEWEF
jgi:hypothetical protein